MVHFDAHTDTNDRYFGENKYTHGTPFRRAIEEGLLDPKRTVQIGIRGSLYVRDSYAYNHEAALRGVERFRVAGPARRVGNRFPLERPVRPTAR